MDWYSILKFAHVFAAIVWLGGGFTMLLLGTLAQRNGPEAVLINLRNTNALGMLLFVPSSLATLATGILLAILWTGFGDLWLVIGLVGAASTSLTGALFIKPYGEKIQAVIDREGVSPAALLMGKRLLRVARIDYAAMVVIVAAMVLKPGYGDHAILAVMAAWMVAAVTFILLQRRDAGTEVAA